MRYIFAFLFIFILFNLNAQENWIGNFSINKTSFDGHTDSIKATIDIYSPSITQTPVENPLISCSVSFFSPWMISENDLIRDHYEFNLSFQKAIDGKHRYFAEIPSNMLVKGFYCTEFKISFDGGNTFLQHKIDNIAGSYITIGNIGTGGIFSSIIINSEEKLYSFMDIHGDKEFVPENLEGIYSTGFCKDEYVELNSFNLLLWGDRNDHLSVDLFYSIDGGDYLVFDKFTIEDDSKDGLLSFNDKLYYFESPTTVLFTLKLATEIKDLLQEMNLDGDSEHKFEFYFKIKSSIAEYTFPENNSMDINLKVADSPLGADCQAALLPIDLLYWEAVIKEKSVYFKWGTASEFNNDYFEIERSTDANNWKSIKRIEGHSNSKDVHHYNSIDEYPLNGINYYRLKQTDFDGSHKYSRVNSIKNFENELILYPNPIKDILYYQVTDPVKKYIIEITDLSGKTIKSVIVPEALKTTSHLDLTDLKEGLYILKYINTHNHQVKSQKLIKF